MKASHFSIVTRACAKHFSVQPGSRPLPLKRAKSEKSEGRIRFTAVCRAKRKFRLVMRFSAAFRTARLYCSLSHSDRLTGTGRKRDAHLRRGTGRLLSAFFNYLARYCDDEEACAWQWSRAALLIQRIISIFKFRPLSTRK